MESRDLGLDTDFEATNDAQVRDYKKWDRELEDAGMKSPFDRGNRIFLERDLFGNQMIFSRPDPKPHEFR